MREFLCKGKRKKNGEWVTGHYQRRIHILDKIEHLIYHYESYEDWEYAEIIPETCCQYSELLDKAHNGIWENDLVKEDWGDCIGIVQYGLHGKEFGWYIKWLSPKANGFREDIPYWLNEITVIGNGIDNADAIKKIQAGGGLDEL